MMDSALRKNLSPREAASMLLESARYRTTKEKLERFAGGRELRPLLTEGLLRDDPDQMPESVDRKVRNWLREDKNTDIPRETAMELAFILELDIEHTNAFLASLTEEGLRWRDPKEIVMIFARMQGMTYPEAVSLRTRLGNFEARADALPVQKENLTASVCNQVLQLQSEEELVRFLNSSGDVMGQMHNTAYYLFTRFLQLLEAPDAPPGEKEDFERKMTVREILRVYLYRDIVPAASRKKKDAGPGPALTPQQKEIFGRIRSGWPDETSLSRMKSREIDVNRKTLLLLFLATDGAGMSFGRSGRPVSADALYKDSCARINRMLGGCGYSRLDARSPFDWLVIYCLCVDVLWETDTRMAQTLTELFSGNEIQTPPIA